MLVAWNLTIYSQSPATTQVVLRTLVNIVARSSTPVKSFLDIDTVVVKHTNLTSNYRYNIEILQDCGTSCHDKSTYTIFEVLLKC